MRSGIRTILLLVTCAAALACFAPVAAAAPGEVLWEKSWNFDPAQTVYNAHVARGSHGDLYLAVCLDHSATTGTDWAVVRYTAAGAKKWQRVYAGPGKTDWLQAAAADGKGNVVLCGRSESAAGDPAFTVVKWSRSGKRLWVKRIQGSDIGKEDCAMDVAVDGAGDVYVTGWLAQSATGADWLTVKYTPSGKRLWQRRFNSGSGNSDEATALALDSSGRVYVTGYRGTGTGATDMGVVRYSAKGHRDWAFTWGNAGDVSDYGLDIAVNNAGVAVAGYGSGGLLTPGQGEILKLRRSGTGGWHTTLGGADGILGSTLTAVGLDGDGDVVAGGSAETSAPQGYDFVLSKYDLAGGLIDHMQVAGTAGHQDSAAALAITSGGTVFATGFQQSTIGGYDAYTIGFNTHWSQFFSVFYDDPAHGDDSGQSLAPASGCLYVAGRKAGDAWLVKYAR